MESITSETAERKGIDNHPSAAVLEVMDKSAMGMEKIRAVLMNKAIHINSWYRSHDLNKIIGGVDTSQHIDGEAIDFICPIFGDPLAICKAIIAQKELIRFDQLILEHTWVHVSFAILSGKPRGQVLSLLSSGKYALGLTDKNGVSYE
jgi:hypothetical protein